MISLNDVLLAASNIPVDDPIAEIWGRGLQSGYRIIEYTGTLPITISANGDALLDYRIYGTDGGVGVAMENLFDISRERSDVFTLNPNYYIYGGNAVNKGVSSSGVNIVVTNKLEVSSNTGSGAGFIIPVRPSTTYTLSYDLDISISDNKTSAVLNFIDDDENLGTYFGVYGNTTKNTFTTKSNTKYVYIIFRTIYYTATYSNITLAEGSYGYKLPMMTRGENLFDPNDPGIERGYYYGYNNGISTAYGENSWESGWIPVTPGDYTFYLKRNYVGFYLYVNFYNSQKEFVKTIVSATNPDGFYTRTISDVGYVRFNGINAYATDWLVARGNVTKYTPYSRTDTPVYIGENQLGAGEYVSYGEQKIYRDVDGTLTPTNPPVPLPEIPTIDGTTVIDYDGDPKPSQMYVKCKGKSGGA